MLLSVTTPLLHGPPPHVHWWMTSTSPTPDQIFVFGWRWWNGLNWSVPVSASVHPSRLPFYATLPASHLIAENLCWCLYWPAGARVPRVNPNTGEVTGKAWSS